MRGRRGEQSAFSLFSFQDIVTSVMGIMILVLLVIALELATRQMQSPVVQHAITRTDSRAALADARQRIDRLKQDLISGAFTGLAGTSRSQVEHDSDELKRLLPRLESDLYAAQQREKQLRRQHREADEKLAARGVEQTELEQLQRELKELEAELARLKSSTAIFFRIGSHSGKQPWLVQISGSGILAAPLGPVSKPLQFAGDTPASRQRQFLAWAQSRSRSGDYFVLLIQPGGTTIASEIEETLRKEGFGVGLDLLGAEQVVIDAERGAPAEPPATGGG